MELPKAEEFILSLPGSKAVELNDHIKTALQEYTCNAAIIHMGINNILHWKDNEELKELPNNIMKIVHTCQECNPGKYLFDPL